MSALRTVCLAIGAMAVAAVSAPAFAQQPSGIVIAVIQQAEVDSTTGKLVLQPESPIRSGDTIITGRVGQAQIKFRDDTKLVVGPNSEMVIDAFVFAGDQPRNISINALRGAFRFITGNGPKDAYSITTPTATIGVRGTEFDLDIDGAGTTRLVNIEGRTRICDRINATQANYPGRRMQGCVETGDPCGVSIIQQGRDLKQLSDRWERNRELNWYFRYIRNQSDLLPEFQVALGACGDRSITPASSSGGNPPSNPPPPPPPPDPWGGPHKPDYKPDYKPDWKPDGEHSWKPKGDGDGGRPKWSGGDGNGNGWDGKKHGGGDTT